MVGRAALKRLLLGLAPDEACHAADCYHDVFLRMDGKGISTACGAGAGKVNCQRSMDDRHHFTFAHAETDIVQYIGLHTAFLIAFAQYHDEQGSPARVFSATQVL